MTRLSDGEIFGQVRRGIEKDARVKSALLIHLSVENGVVQLWGDVGSASEKAAVEKIVRSQSSAADVVNSLTVVMANAGHNDRKAMAKTVEEALTRVRGVPSDDIGVASVDRGIIRLVGRAYSLAEERAAIEAASNVPGVSEVISEVTIGSAKVNEAIEIVDDLALEGRVSNAIAERGVTIYGDQTHVSGGIVYLRGHVTERREITLSEQAAAAVGGIRDVVNELVVGHAMTSSDPDEALAARVSNVMQREDRLSPAEIHVEATEGNIRLFGHVESLDQQNVAAAVAQRVPGVRRVWNDLVIVDRSPLPKARAIGHPTQNG